MMSIIKLKLFYNEKILTKHEKKLINQIKLGKNSYQIMRYKYEYS